MGTWRWIPEKRGSCPGSPGSSWCEAGMLALKRDLEIISLPQCGWRNTLRNELDSLPFQLTETNITCLGR
jgi:hypothetical protein